MTADAIGGVWNYSVNLIRALAPYGVDVILATMGRRPSADQRRQVATISNLCLAESDFKLEWMDDPWTDINRASDWLLQLESKWKPAVIHLNGYSHSALPWHVPHLVVAHSCVLSWWAAVRRIALPNQWLTYAERVAEGLRTAELVIAPTAAMLAELRRIYQWDGRGVVIWNGLVPPAPDTSISKQEFLLTAGRLWDEAKNLPAVEAIAQKISWPVYAAGEAEASAQGCSVRRLGYLSAPEMREWMARASIYVLPARYEPFGLSILEAALSQCALVIGDIPSLRELWEGAAWLVAPDDISELRHALMTLIRQPALRGEFAVRARDRARRYEPERMAKQYLAVYHNLLEG
ncbi:MAG: glycosyltransferase family 4 protein [Deltaproteobacteria bacterium]|nr:glycosyltransferase family 4 protein [Deltaproteobacteria bacterium]